MRNVWIIARREYKLFFISPIAYVVAFFFIILLGYFFYTGLLEAITYLMYYQSFAPGVEIIVGPMVTLLIFAMPAVTMRSIAEEMRRRHALPIKAAQKVDKATRISFLNGDFIDRNLFIWLYFLTIYNYKHLILKIP